MALEFLNDTPQRAFRKLERDLMLVNPEVKLGQYKAMTPRSLDNVLESLDGKRNTMLAENTYGAWLVSEEYVELQLMKEAVTFLKEYKEGKRDDENLVPGYTYYRTIKQFGDDLVGHRCYFRENATPLWVPWKINANVAKALEVMRHGGEEDFSRIYVEMANGRLNALESVSIEHLTESDADSLQTIGEYCDTRWDGAWPWETPSPYTLRESIEETNEMNLSTINEMQSQFTTLLTSLNEESMDKYEVIAAAEEMAKTIEKMVEQVARLGGEGIIKLKNQIRISMGDDAAAQIEDKFLEPVRQAADALSQLQSTILHTVENLKNADEAGVGGDPAAGGGIGADPMGGGDDLGSPVDAMGADPMGGGDLGGDPLGGDDLADDLADASLDGGDGERPMKDM
jgi:hypothetical protein